MDILNWLRIKKQQLIRTTLDSPKDLVVLGADVSFQKRGDKYQSYAMPAEDFLATAARPYKVYTALLTQSGGDDPQTLTSGAVTEGVTYDLFFMKPPQPWDFSNVGGPVYPDSYAFVATSSDVPNDYGNAVLNYNTGAPVVTVLENTIGNVWFTYQDVGTYVINSDGLFTNSKTIGFTTFPNWDNDATNAFLTQKTSDYMELITMLPNDSKFNNFTNLAIEIRVYN